MTNTGVDYPDFTDFPRFGSAPIIDESRNVGFGPDVLGPFYVGNWETVQVNTPAIAAGRGWTFAFKWWADAAATKQVGVFTYRTRLATLIADTIPNRGPWLTVEVQSTAAGAANYQLRVVPRNGVKPGGGSFGDGYLRANNALNIGPGATSAVALFFVASGRGTLTVTTAATAWSAAIVSYDELAAALGPFAGMGSAGGFAQTTVFNLGPYYSELSLTNNDGVARNFGYSVMLDL